jgi:hypothetical protein
MTTATTFGSNNARTRMLTSQPPLIEWFASFGVAQQWVSDQGIHFKNKVMTDIQNNLASNTISQRRIVDGQMVQVKLSVSKP